MPNWCDCDLYVRGPAQEIDKFLEAVDDGIDEEGEKQLSICAKLYPIPEELNITATALASKESDSELFEKQMNNINKYGYKDWYDWCVQNWGSKWGDCDTHIDYYEEDNDIVAITFKSPWSPPMEAFKKISKDFPNLSFRIEYYEAGMGYEGKSDINDGEETVLYFSEDYIGGRGG